MSWSFLSRALAGAALTTVFAATPGAAVVRYTLGASAEVVASSNPLLLGGDDLEALSAEASILPGLLATDEEGSSLELTGTLTGRTYSRRYGSFLLGDVRADGTLRQSEKLSFMGSAVYRRDVSADVLDEGVDASADPRSTRNAIETAAMLVWRQSARDTMTPRLRYEVVSFEDSPTLETTRTLTADVSWNRNVTERTELGFRAAAAFAEAGDDAEFTTYSLFGTIDQHLAPQLRLTAELGLEHSKAERGTLGGDDSRLTFSGRGQLCRTGERTEGCLVASVASEISALGALQRRYSIGANLTRRTSERMSLGAALSYDRAARSGDAFAPALSAASARAFADWRLAETTTLSGFVEYRRREIGGFRPDAGFAGVRLRWERR